MFVKSEEELSDDEFTENNKDRTISDEIRTWALIFKISHVALSALLLILLAHSCFSEMFPKTAKTFLKTPRFTKMKTMAPGKYWHYGITNAIRAALKYCKDIPSKIKINIGIDGLPLGCAKELWPILGSLVNNSRVFLIGAYCGRRKPDDMNEFLEEFVGEMNHLIENGMEYNGCHYDVELHGLMADAVAKAAILGIKGHTGYHSCTKCVVEGDYLAKRMSFYQVDCTKRTDESVAAQEDEDHHLRECILNEIKTFGIVTRVPLDYMHLVCIGTVKKLVKIWMTEKVLSGADQQKISDKLLALHPHSPKEFARLPGELGKITKWKATQCRRFLLYDGVVVLPDIFRHGMKRYYDNFLSLHYAIRIMCSETLIQDHLDYAEKNLLYFVNTFAELFGQHLVSHNIHGLIHLADDCRTFGALDYFSCFSYENMLKTLKSLLRKPGDTLQQIHRRYVELEGDAMRAPKQAQESGLQQYRRRGPTVAELGRPPYYRYIQNGCTYAVDSPNDCCALKDGSVIRIRAFTSSSTGELYVNGLKFQTLKPLYPHADVSDLLKCYEANSLETGGSWPIAEIAHKCMIAPVDDEEHKFRVLPILHSETFKLKL